MARARMGEILVNTVPLSNHDVEEILNEQQVSHRRFGEIAMQFGLCSSDHVVGAWATQLGDRRERVDLEQAGVDTQAADIMPAALAWAYRVVAIRATKDGSLVVAVAEEDYARAAVEVPRTLERRVSFVIAEPTQISAALCRYYALAAAG